MTIQQIFGEAKGKMNGYIVLLAVRYSNLCVKADALSLLPVTVKTDGTENDLEKVADVAIQNDEVIAVIPKFSNILFDIGKGIMKAHPEFKMDVVDNETNSNTNGGKYLTFTMPEVDDNRYDMLNDGVDGLNNQCKAKIDKIQAESSAKIGKALEGASPQTIKEASDELQNLRDFFDKTMESLTNNKKKEIEEAHQRWLAKQQQQQQQQQEKQAAHNEQVATSMKIEN